MSKLPAYLITAFAAAASLAAPASAASSESSMGNVPYCSAGISTDYSRQMERLSNQLQLSTKLRAIIDQSNGCIAVTIIEDGSTVRSYYDPDSLRLVARFE